ncbi:MAG: transglycosylase SLT domain-containing protein [Thermodesulfobacteriota bacterium]
MKRQTSREHRCTLPWPVARTLIALAVAILGVLGDQGHCYAQSGYWRAHYVLPKELRKTGVVFAGERIPLNREGVATRVVEQMNYLLMDRRASMMEWFDRMAQYSEPVRRVLAEEKIPSDLIYLSVLIGDFSPGTKTSSRGVGWWALAPTETKGGASDAQWVSTNDWDDRRDPEISTRIACSMLHRLHSKKETGNWLLTVCAFVDGAEKIEASVKKAPAFTFWDIVLPPRSEVLVPRLVALKIIDSHRDFYGVDVPRLQPVRSDSLGRLKLEKELPLHVVAKWCKVTPRALWELNPGVEPGTGAIPKPDKRSPSGFPLRVPKGREAQVRDLLIKDGYLKP